MTSMTSWYKFPGRSPLTCGITTIQISSCVAFVFDLRSKCVCVAQWRN